VERGPADATFNRGKSRAPAAPSARCAKRPSDMRTTRARAAVGVSRRQSAACEATAGANADKLAKNVNLAVVKIGNYSAGTTSAAGASAEVSAAEAAAAAESEALLQRAEATSLEALLEDWTT